MASPLQAIVAEGLVLIGKGTRVRGEISDCDLVEVQGVFEGTVVTKHVVMREGGGFNGSLETDNAEVHGIAQGTIVVRDLLDVRSTGKVTAELAYGRLSVATGGFIAGNVRTNEGSEFTEQTSSPNGSGYLNGDVFSH